MSWKTKHIYNHRWRAVRLLVLERDGYVCQIRGAKCVGEATEVDHVIPVEFGGMWHDPENLRAACGPCNHGRRPPSSVRRHPSREW